LDILLEKLMKIDKDNQVLLNKIMDIKTCPLAKTQQKKERVFKNSKTLHQTERKLNAEKIDKENFSFAKRLAQP